MLLSELSQRRVAIWGFGREGQATLEVLQEKLPSLEVTILNDKEIDMSAHPRLSSEHCEVLTGARVLSSLSDFEVVIKSPGITPYIPAVEAAKEQGTVFTSATNIWFANHPTQKTICVTGTKGKSTTSSLIAFLLEAAGHSVTLAGNIGVPLLQHFQSPEPPDFFVVELSSYQTSDFTGAPDIGVLLNLYPEHLNWHGDVESYFRDKTKLFNHMRSDGITILNGQDAQTSQMPNVWTNPYYYMTEEGFHVREDGIYKGDMLAVPGSLLSLRGAHNWANVCAALSVLEALSIPWQEAVQSLPSFRGLAHRLMPIGERDGRLFIDDSISTTPQSAIAAMDAYRHRPITLLVGGYDRQLDVTPLVESLLSTPIHAVITMPDTGSRIAEDLLHRGAALEGGVPFLLERTQSLEEAVTKALSCTDEGGVVLLSPAAPSYHQFKNFQERGEVFAKLTGCAKKETQS
ncbi:MAG: UDP-N-acetylmuramoyl-L-alanine--D-glutamate ligase [Deltaproteobacteria bacterium]|nr:UDP-N-acetylmuramoyl-L-alanine--D-glutamate ligase [Deltaproteobacteria bacterium]MBU50811.1 UDP-N-acetylmuramoyl-L-alanine--D-glutamate ligase [Deltaproteobacteria bacterium]|tara:strand:+ start:7517 stop:8896 length:1380 start_codon:yes stop_codon:yes gene_type:complete